jgi:HAD superfamily hydrolase (TIGR01509 family)
MLKAIIFDLDHTLLDWDAAEPWDKFEARRLQNVFEFVHNHVYPLDGADADSFFAEFVTKITAAWVDGNRTLRAPDITTILARTIQSFGVPLARLDLVAVGRAYDWGLVEGVRPFPDVIEVLPQLRAHGLDLGIVTNASHPMCWRDRELAALDLLDWFPACRVAAVDVGYLKPHRAIFDRAFELLGIQADEAVFVGDNLEADIKGAQGVGMVAVLRTGPDGDEHTAEHGGDSAEASEIIPDGTLHTLHDLLPLLDGWFPGWRNGRA